jgi:broad specificity phosphatase PhoE
MASPMTLHLIRHGEVHNPRQILYGRLPRFRLSDSGRWQAKQCGKRLNGSGIDAIYSSPLLRARQTAEEIIRRCGPNKLHISRLLNEVYTAYEGDRGPKWMPEGGIFTAALRTAMSSRKMLCAGH